MAFLIYFYVYYMYLYHEFIFTVLGIYREILLHFELLL